MNAMEAMLSRRSIRKYKDIMVPRELLDRILEAGTYAATGRGAQSPIMIAVTNRQMRDKLSRMNAAIMGTDSDPFYGAPVVIVVLADKSKPTVNIHDGSLVMGNLMLAAHELAAAGSTGPRRSLNPRKAKRSFALLASRESMSVLAIVYWAIPTVSCPKPLPARRTISTISTDSSK